MSVPAFREVEIRALLNAGPATDCLDEIEREVARDAYALAVEDIVAQLRTWQAFGYPFDLAFAVEQQFAERQFGQVPVVGTPPVLDTTGEMDALERERKP